MHLGYGHEGENIFSRERCFTMENTDMHVISADVYARFEYNTCIEVAVSDQATGEEIQQRLNEAAQLAIAEMLQTYQGLQPEITITRLDEEDKGNRALKNVSAAYTGPITAEVLQQLPPFVAAVVSDYSTHEEGQRWFLYDIEYDLQGLDPLPIKDGSTCEIWAQGWVWRGRNGTISLSPFMAQPQGSELEEAFAWAVERENTDMQHVRVWRIQCPELQVPDSHAQTQTVETTQQKTLSKQDVFALARLFQEQEKLLRVVRMVEMAYGKECQAARVILQGGENPLGGGIRYRHLDSMTVFDRDGNEFSPDLRLPFWQECSDLDLLLARPGDEYYSDAVDGYGDPAEGTPAYRLAAAIDELIQKEYGPLDAEARYELDLESEACQKLLHLPFPQIFGNINIPSFAEIDSMK